MNTKKAKEIFNVLPVGEKIELIEKIMPHSGAYRQLQNSGDWSDKQWQMLGDEFLNSIYWERGSELDKICVHDKTHIVNGKSDIGNKYQAVGFYSDDSLLFIEDLQLIKN